VNPPGLLIHPVTDLPLVQSGDNLALLIGTACKRAGFALQHGDVLVLAQKIVSKAEGRQVLLADVEVSAEALKIAGEVDKDPRLVELVLRESDTIIRKTRGVLIVRHRLGIVSANAGIDQSNISHDEGESALLLPLDPDESARRVRADFAAGNGPGKGAAGGLNLGVIISDSINRPWRMGTVGIAIGSAGITVLDDRRGQADMFGRELKVTLINRADSIATAAMLVMGETTERVPAAIVRGFPAEDSSQAAADCLRPLAEDLFR
jgi:coenzyme F420-0:L-glutamate ligase/coenzyme F420-1:gamma-L-glutamate ligase